MPRAKLHPDDKKNYRSPVPLSPVEAELIDGGAATVFESRAEFLRNAGKERARMLLSRKVCPHGCRPRPKV